MSIIRSPDNRLVNNRIKVLKKLLSQIELSLAKIEKEEEFIINIFKILPSKPWYQNILTKKNQIKNC